MARVRILLASVLATAALAALVASGCGRREETPAPRETAPPPTETAATTGTEPGMMPPSFTLQDLAGNTVSLSDFGGRVVVLDLWATWCPPCREEIPFLVDLYKQYRDQGLVVVGIGLDQGGAAALRPFAEKNGMDYPVLVGTRSVQMAYGASSIPRTFVIGRDGRIVHKHVGFGASSAPGMREEIVKLLAAAPEA